MSVWKWIEVTDKDRGWIARHIQPGTTPKVVKVNGEDTVWAYVSDKPHK